MGHRYTGNHLDLEAVFGPRLKELWSQAPAAGLGSSGPVGSQATVFSPEHYFTSVEIPFAKGWHPGLVSFL